MSDECKDVLDEVYLYLDLECSDERRQLIKQHLDECSPCLREYGICLLYTSPSPRDRQKSRMPSSA